MAPRASEELSTVTYTDAPVTIKLLPGGQFEMPSESNVLLHWTTNRIQIPLSDAPLSIRWTRGGQRFFTIQGSRYVVDDNSYLILNGGQHSTTEIDSPTPIQCFTVCFRPDTVADVLRSLVTPADRLLDEPQAGSGQPLTFVQRTYSHDHIVSPVLCRLQQPQESALPSASRASAPSEACSTSGQACLPLCIAIVTRIARARFLIVWKELSELTDVNHYILLLLY